MIIAIMNLIGRFGKFVILPVAMIFGTIEDVNALIEEIFG